MKPDPDALVLAPVSLVLPSSSFIARHAFPILFLGLAFAAFSPIFVRLSEVGPIATAANRLALPLPLFFALLWFRPQDRLPLASTAGRHDLMLIILSGVFFAGDLVLWNTSVLMTTIANASVLANVTPIFVVAGSWILFNERPGRLFAAGMTVAMSGSAIMMVASVNRGESSLEGDLLAMGASAFYAGYVLTLSRVRKRASIVSTMAISGAAASVILLALATLTEQQIWPHSLDGWLVALAMTVFVQISGHMLIAMSLAHVPAGLVATMFLMQPVIPAGVAWILFGENVTIHQIIGALALLAGLEISRRGTAK